MLKNINAIISSPEEIQGIYVLSINNFWCSIMLIIADAMDTQKEIIKKNLNTLFVFLSSTKKYPNSAIYAKEDIKILSRKEEIAVSIIFCKLIYSTL